MIHQTEHLINIEGRKIVEITDIINDYIKKKQLEYGLCNIFLRHTSASLMLTENVDSDVLTDIEYFMKKTVKDNDSGYWHKTEGIDDMSGHIRSIILGVSHTIPIKNNQLYLGTWQGLFLYEHRIGIFKRNFVTTIHN